MGSRVRISGAGAYSGVYTVGDVGPNIKGNKIDVYVGSYDEAIQFGRKVVELTVLSVPRRPVKYARRNSCSGCGNVQAKAIIGVDATRGSSSKPALSVSARAAGDGIGEGNPREGGGASALARMSAVEGPPSN